jgi:iron complex transport system substrate-binding protein
VDKRRRIIIMAAGTLAVFLNLGPQRAQAQSRLPEALSLTEANKEVLVSDAAGRPLRFDTAPRSFLALGSDAAAIADLLAAFAAGRERLIGMEKAPGSSFPLLDRLVPGFAQKAFLAPGWSVSKVAALKPGVVLARGRKLDAAFKALADAGIPVVLLGLDSPERYERDLGIVGSLLAAGERADELIQYYRGLYGRIAIGTAGLAAENKPRVLLARAVLDRGSAVLKLAPVGSMPHGIVKASGGTPWEDAAAKDGSFRTISFSDLAAWDPALITLSVPIGADPAAVLAAFRAGPRAGTLKAFKTGRIFTLPSDLDTWDSADPRWILGLNWLAARVHPGRFSEYAMDADLDAFFDHLYGLDKAAVGALIRPALRQSVK